MTQDETTEESAGAQRIDKWLWCARFVKTRTLATRLVESGKMRITRGGITSRIAKASTLVRPGDQLGFTISDQVRIVRVSACGAERGPAASARELYEDLSPPPQKRNIDDAAGRGRPTKSDRRAMDRFRNSG